MPDATLTIEYCVQWNYYPRAAGLAAEIEKRFDLPTRLIKGSGGVFEIKLGDDELFSKKTSKRFPEPGEVEAALEGKLGVPDW